MLFPFSDDIPRHKPPIVTYALVVLNFFVFMSGLRLSPFERQHAELEYGFIPARVGAVYDNKTLLVDSTVFVRHREKGVMPIERKFEVQPSAVATATTLFTSLFMHGSWMHLIMNMWFLWIFGDNVEERLGHVSYFCFYLLGGLIATACHWGQDPSSTLPVIGASGAVAAILGAFMVTWPYARIRTVVFVIIFFTVVRLPAMVMLGIWFLTQILEAVQEVDGGVAWWAHIGGFIAGAVLMPLVRNPLPPPEPVYDEYRFVDEDDQGEPI